MASHAMRYLPALLTIPQLLSELCRLRVSSDTGVIGLAEFERKLLELDRQIELRAFYRSRDSN